MLKKIFISLFVNTEIQNDIKFFQNLAFFKQFTNWQLKKIASIVYKKDYLKGEIVYNKGEEAKLFCILKNGKIELCGGENKKEVKINEFFGQPPLAREGEIYPDTAKAAENSSVYIMHKREFENLMEEDAKIGFKVAKTMLDNANRQSGNL